MMNELVKVTIVDRIALAMPWAGGLVPASMTYHNARVVLGFEVWQAILVGIVVEAIGFVVIATALDLWEQMQDEASARMQSWTAPVASSLRGQLAVALAGVVVYLVVVVAINAILDNGDGWHKLTKGLMASFGLLGGLMVALRNQLGKRRAALALAQVKQEQVSTEAQAQQLAREQAERDHAWAMEQERLRLEHEERMRKIEEDSRLKIAKIGADGLRQASGKAADGSGKAPDAPGEAPATRLRWADVSPDDYRWIADAPVGEIVKRYQITGKDPERLARTWKQYARKGLE